MQSLRLLGKKRPYNFALVPGVECTHGLSSFTFIGVPMWHFSSSESFAKRKNSIMFSVHLATMEIIFLPAFPTGPFKDFIAGAEKEKKRNSLLLPDRRLFFSPSTAEIYSQIYWNLKR